MTTALDLLRPTGGEGPPRSIGMSARVEADDGGPFASHLAGLDHLHPFGGERRLAHWVAPPANALWDCPGRVRTLFQSVPAPTRVRMVLATPAGFAWGWQPGWLADGGDGTLTGSPPGADVKLQLAGAVVDRWRPLSGWSLRKTGPNDTPGPKPIVRLAPAGSVYFFNVVRGDPRELADRLWLRPVSDDPRHRVDGFGLAAWGVW